MNTDIFKENLKNYYNQEAVLRNKSVKQDWKIEIRQNFLDLVKKEKMKTLLELGAGAGYDSLFFMDNGLKVMAVDLSSEMVNNCKEKGINAYEMDFYHLSSLNKQFHCIWAMNTLLHVPKSDLCHVLNEINLVLEKQGLFYMGVYGGEDFESEYIKPDVSEAPRFFSYYSLSHLKAILENYFQIISFDQFDVERGIDKEIFQSIIMRKNK
jgi:cyclopropane fatty-acyl-phospholipid synthase-like methyltransferase